MPNTTNDDDRLQLLLVYVIMMVSCGARTNKKKLILEGAFVQKCLFVTSTSLDGVKSGIAGIK